MQLVIVSAGGHDYLGQLYQVTMSLGIETECRAAPRVLRTREDYVLALKGGRVPLVVELHKSLVLEAIYAANQQAMLVPAPGAFMAIFPFGLAEATTLHLTNPGQIYWLNEDDVAQRRIHDSFQDLWKRQIASAANLVIAGPQGVRQ